MLVMVVVMNLFENLFPSCYLYGGGHRQLHPSSLVQLIAEEEEKPS